MPFPNFNPVLIQIGPVAIRWYALAYIAGILIGWRYAVALVRNPKIWKGATPPVNERQIDDLVLWITLAILLGGRLGSVLFYNTSVIWTNPLEIFQPWHGGMSFHGALLAVVGVLVWFARPAQSRQASEAGGPGGALRAVRAVLRAHRQLHQRRALGPPDHPAVGNHLPPRRARAAPSERALRGGAGGDHPLHHPAHRHPRVEAAAASAAPSPACSSPSMAFSASRWRMCASRIGICRTFPLGLTMGIMLSVPMVAAGLGLIWWSSRPQALAQSWQPSLDEGDEDEGEADTTLEPTCRNWRRTPSPRQCPNPCPRPNPRPDFGAMSLKARLERLIAEDGPMTVEVFMTLCLHDPEFGYYATRPALGEGGRFHHRAARVADVRRADRALGGGCVGPDGPTRALSADRDGARRRHADERRPARRPRGSGLPEGGGPVAGGDQRAPQASSGRAAGWRRGTRSWAEALSKVPGGAPIILIANELLDCLPARQFVKTASGWAERRVGLDADGALTFGLAPAPADFAPPPRIGEPARRLLGRNLGRANRARR